MAVEYKVYRPKRILNKHKRPDHWFWTRYTAHPYIGCQHGCKYCYWRESKYCPYPDPDDFARLIKVKINAPELLRKELSKTPVGVVGLGDYQPAEWRHRCAGEQAAAGSPVAGAGGAGWTRRPHGCAGQEARGLETHIKAKGSGGRITRAFCFEAH